MKIPPFPHPRSGLSFHQPSRPCQRPVDDVNTLANIGACFLQ